MSDEIRELCTEINALKENVAELEAENKKLKEENEILKAEKVQQNLAESTSAISSSSRPMKRSHGGEYDEFAPNIKRLKIKILTNDSVPNWLFEVLAWINRIEMANSSLSTSSKAFKQLCWPKLHQNVKPHKIPYLTFSRARFELGNFRALLRRNLVDGEEVEVYEEDFTFIPIASIPPPAYIVGIEGMHLNFLNEEIVNFIKNIAHLLQNFQLVLHAELDFQLVPWKMDKKRIDSIRYFLELLADKICGLDMHNWPSLNDFNQLFPGHLDHIQSIFYEQNTPIMDNDVILNWLTTNQSNNNNRKQKIIEYCDFEPEQIVMNSLISRIKEEFPNSTSSSIFLIRFQAFQNGEEFTLENEQTNEILTSYEKNDKFYLARYPKGEEHWKEEGEEKVQIRGYRIIQIDVEYYRYC